MDAESFKMMVLMLNRFVRRLTRPAGWIVAACLMGSLSACKVGPDYVRPTAEVGVTFKESAGWRPARPMADAPRGPWWDMYQDPVLSDLMQN